MQECQTRKTGLIHRSLGLQATLLIVGITTLTLTITAVICDYFDQKALQRSMESSAREVSSLLRLIIDKPMVVGDDEGTSREFAFLADKFPGVNISIASFTGSITYSTDQRDVRKSLSSLFSGAMSKDSSSLFQRLAQQALRGEEPQGTLLAVHGRNKFLHVSPIRNDKNCYHCHGSSQPVLGAMAIFQDVEDHVHEGLLRTLRSSGFSLLGGVVLVAVIFFFIRRRIIQRLATLEETSSLILQGDYNARFTVNGQDELGRLAENLGNMLQSLKQVGVAQSVVEGLTTPSAMCDTQGRLVFVNKTLLALLEEDREQQEILGVSGNELLYGETQCRSSVFDEVLRNKSVCLDREETLKTRKGRERKVRLDANPVTDLEGVLIGAFVSVMDLTAIRENEAAIMANNSTINKTAQEASALAVEMGKAINALAVQIESTREQSSRQQFQTEQTVQALEEMRQGMGDVTRTAGQVADHAGQTKESAVQGASQAGHVSEGMHAMVQSITVLNARMEELGDKTQAISEVMRLIQEIADQTNLLALNAAIEAARAGDAGRGFAVVADEVRKLAEKTMQATVEVGRTIKEIQNSAVSNIKAVEQTGQSVERSSEEVRTTGEVLQRILSLAESVADEISSIASAMEQQSASTESVNASILAIQDIAQQSADSTAATETAVRSLMDVADRLNGIIAGMTVKEL